MKRFILVIAIFALVFTSACRQLPLSEETGVGPGQYTGKAGIEEIKNENESLKEELENTRDQLDKTLEELEELEKEYLSLAKSNENIIFRLEEAESKLKIVESTDIPKFNTESTDKNSIISYLKESSKLIDDSIKGIEVISTDTKIVFRTLGYGQAYSQIFIWHEGDNEPVMVDGAVLDKDGTYEWLGSYLLLKNSGKNKVLDIENEKIRGTFDDPQKYLLLEGTTTLLLKDKDNKFVLYDFVNDTNKEIKLDNNKYSDFSLHKDSLVFTGTYVEDDVEYEMKASISLDKLRDLYDLEANEALEFTDEAGEDTV